MFNQLKFFCKVLHGVELWMLEKLHAEFTSDQMTHTIGEHASAHSKELNR